MHVADCLQVCLNIMEKFVWQVGEWFLQDKGFIFRMKEAFTFMQIHHRIMQMAASRSVQVDEGRN